MMAVLCKRRRPRLQKQSGRRGVLEIDHRVVRRSTGALCLEIPLNNYRRKRASITLLTDKDAAFHSFSMQDP